MQRHKINKIKYVTDYNRNNYKRLFINFKEEFPNEVEEIKKEFNISLTEIFRIGINTLKENLEK